MKNLLRTGLIATGLFLSTGVFANDGELSFVVKPLNENRIAFFSYDAQVVSLSVSTADKEVLYNEEVKMKGGATTTYNLNYLHDGTYTFKFESLDKSVEYKVVILKGKTEVSSPKVIEKA